MEAATDERGRIGRSEGGVHLDRRWIRIGRNAGYVVAAAFFAGTVLFLLDALNVLGSGPEYHATAAGPLQDEANFWAATFAHKHDIVWDIIARDTLLPLAFVALIVVALALRQWVGFERPEAQLMVALLIVGGTLSVIADLIFLGDAEFWRLTGWSAHPAATMVAVGRASQAIDLLTRWPEAVGFAILAPGVFYLGRLCRMSPALPNRVGTLAYVEGPLLVGIALAGVAGWDMAYQVLSLVLGALIAPVIGLGLGRAFGRLSHSGE